MQSRALNTQPKFSFLFTKWSNTFELEASIDFVFGIHMWNHASNMQSKFSFLFTKWSNAFEHKALIDSVLGIQLQSHASNMHPSLVFNSQSEAMLLNRKPWLILY